MPNSINSLSPSFRDFLLLKNLVTDTVVDNGLQSLLGGIGFPVQTETLPNAVQPSTSISSTGPIYQELNTILNQYQGTENDYTQVEIVLNQSTNSSIGSSTPYTNNNQLLNGELYYNGNVVTSESLRKDLTLKNVYIDKPKQTVINLNTQPVATFQNLTSYIDENNNLSVGGPGTQALDILGGLIGGQGVGLSFGGANGGVGLVANEDIRSTLLGRVLGATGVINDTPLGNIGGQQLLTHVGYNAAFGLQQETLGSLNLNPLSLLQGKSLVTLNYSITVPKGDVGRIVNYAANILGVQSPVSLLEQSSSIFSFSDKLEYIGMSNIEKANEMIKNSGMGQVQALMNHMRANTNIANPNGTTLRQGYAPGYKDDRKTKGENVGDGINPKLYARDNGEGGIIDFINGKENSPVSSGNYDRPGQIINDGWYEDYRGFYVDADIPLSESDKELMRVGALKLLYKDAFGWTDDYNNTPENIKDFNQETLFNNPKTLLYKTRKIFETNRMQTLISGHGVKDDAESQIQTAVSSIGNFVSKGSGVLSYNALINGVSDDPAKVFCRTWTTYDRYDMVFDLQKNRGLYGGKKNSVIFRRNVEFSVLEDNGFARVAPYKTDKMATIVDAEGANGSKLKTYKGDTDNKRYMFSIENLAWNDNLVNLLPCEVGPGDPLSGHRGRIMWFPPYDINFSETTSASWDKHNFIGRGEPIYTYNNTERTGNLSWKIIIDHPNYLNFIGKANGITPKNYDEFLASYFAGCIPQEDLQAILTTEEIDKTEVVNVEEKPVEKLEPDKEPPSFDIYFPNDVYDLNKYPNYENGLSGNTSGFTGTTTALNGALPLINYKTNPTGAGFGLGSYYELCYQFDVNGKKTWSTQQCTKSKGPKGANGREEPDRTNFALNTTGTTTSYRDNSSARIGDKRYVLGWRDPQYAKDLQQYLITKCKTCKIEVLGYASTVGTFGDNRNDELSKLRAESVKDWLKNNLLTDPTFSERISVVAAGKGATDSRGTCPETNIAARNKNYKVSKNDVYGCKANRYVTVRFVVDPNLKPKDDPKPVPPPVPTPPKVPNLPVARFYSECDYFEKLEQSDKTAYNSIKDKIRFFQPAFHSTTPEGFNSRLTFLQQCMRQGPTQGAGVTSNPNNLAFGRPPICILRVGDFYHTKIVIENVSFAFEPLVWDLNPEGVGVQPMICNVDMSFSFIGGSSLRGPINRLQNAVSFNYYANTEIYDPRADTIKIVEGSNSGVTVDGVKTLIADYNVSPEAQNIAGLSAKPVPVANQIAQNENANSDSQPLTDGTTGTTGTTITSNSGNPDEVIFSNANIMKQYLFTIEYSGLFNNDKLKGRFGITTPGKLSKDYDAILRLVTGQGTVDVATFKISGPDGSIPNAGDYTSKLSGWREALAQASDPKDNGVIFVVYVPEFKQNYYSVRAISAFECPEEDIKLHDIVDYGDWKAILEDPCCSCWPNGTGNSEIQIKNYNGDIIKCPTTGCTGN